LPLAIGLVRWRGWQTTFSDRRAQVIAVWMFPCLAFYMLIMMGQQGLIFVYLPALILLGAASLVKLAEVSARSRLPSYGFLSLTLVFSCWLFVLAPEYLAGRSDLKVLNWSTIQDTDAHYTSFINQVKGNLIPSDTVILTTNWRHVEYYLPGYLVLHMPSADDDSTYRFAATGPQARISQLNVVLFDVLSTDWNSTSPVHDGAGESARLVLLPLHPGEVLVYSNKQIQVE
jgi:hypothetical protein